MWQIRRLNVEERERLRRNTDGADNMMRGLVRVKYNDKNAKTRFYHAERENNKKRKKKKSRRHNLRLRHPQIPALMLHTHNHDLVHRQRAGPDAQMRHRALARKLLAEEEEARVAREDFLGELCARDRFPGG